MVLLPLIVCFYREHSFKGSCRPPIHGRGRVSKRRRARFFLGRKPTLCEPLRQKCDEGNMRPAVQWLDQTPVHKYGKKWNTRKVILFFIYTSRTHLSLTELKRCHILRRFRRMGRFPGVLGAIDCTHVAIVTPVEGEEGYKNHKGFYSLNAQMVTFYFFL